VAEPTPYPATAALLEPRVNFDPFDLRTTATREGECIVLNGEKGYVPNAAGAEWFLIYARDGENGRVRGCLVERAAAGLTVQEREKLMGIHGLPAYRMNLNQVRVSPDLELGGESGIDFDRLVNHMNVGLAAMAAGVMRASYEYAREYAKERIQFGKPIAAKQAIAFMLAECAIEVDSTRLLAWEAAWQMEAKKPVQEVRQAAYLAREYANKAALFVTDCGVQILGGHGFIREHPVERWLRNARGFPMFTGLAIA
jgi:alkylation response protein AidB-like acyl-CoA dehydrogenase